MSMGRKLVVYLRVKDKLVLGARKYTKIAEFLHKI
jgi:hypothetical protein